MAQIVLKYDTDFTGNDVDVKRNYSLEQCTQACLNSSKYLCFTYNPSNRNCYLKNPVPNEKSYRGAISGIKQL